MEGLNGHTVKHHERLETGDKTTFRSFRHSHIDRTILLMFVTTPLGLGLRCRWSFLLGDKVKTSRDSSVKDWANSGKPNLTNR